MCRYFGMVHILVITSARRKPKPNSIFFKVAVFQQKKNDVGEDQGEFYL